MNNNMIETDITTDCRAAKHAEVKNWGGGFRETNATRT